MPRKKTNYALCLVCQSRPKTDGETTCEPCAYRMSHADEIKGDILAPAIIRNITSNLREFGYQVDESVVLAEVTLIATGQPPVSIIGRFARNMLVEARLMRE